MNTIIIADKQDITKAGIIYFLRGFKEIGKLIEVSDKKELVTSISKEPDSIIILDYTNYDFKGTEDLINLSYRFPGSIWILFSDELSNDFIRYIIFNTKNISILLKESVKEEINTAIALSLKKERYICSYANNQLIGIYNETPEKQDKILTATELEILKHIALGKTTKEIAAERFSSIHTITTHRKNIFRKLEINSVHEATRYALRAGYIDSAEYYI
jgi:DNA-binding NarL/FixJ family response regulator